MLSITVDTKEGPKTYHTNTSWLSKAGKERLEYCRKYCQTMSNFTGYVTMGGAFWASTTISKLAAFPLAYRIAGSVAIGFLLKSTLFSTTKLMKTYSGATGLYLEPCLPFWEHPNRVPDLDKMFFELDDNQGFKPNILHHGLGENQLKNFFPDFIYRAPTQSEAPVEY